MLKLRKPALRKAGLSGAKILAMKDLARKTLATWVPRAKMWAFRPFRDVS